MKRSWRAKDTKSCIYCDSPNVIHWVINGTGVVVHKCEDCKQKWDDPVEEEA